MFGAIARTPSKVWYPLMGEDCLSTLKSLEQMGLDYSIEHSYVELNPPTEWRQPDAALDCGNSGTTMRLLAGLIASRPITATLVGDESLSKRPMKRVAVPLNLMGAKVEGDTPPLKIEGADLVGIHYNSPVASAQIKTATLLAGLRASGETWVTEPAKSRDQFLKRVFQLG